MWGEQEGTEWLRLGQLQAPAAGRFAVQGGTAPAQPRHPIQDKLPGLAVRLQPLGSTQPGFSLPLPTQASEKPFFL